MTDGMPVLLDYYKKLSIYFGPQKWWPGETKVEILVGAILAQHTSWKNVEKALSTLKTFNLLDVRKIYELDIETLAEAIRSAGTYRRKAERLKVLFKWFVERYDGNVDKVKAADHQRLREELLDLRGIGKETCDAILLYVFDIPYFVIDTYAYRVSSRHALVPEETTYEEMQGLFHQQLGRDAKLFNEYHALIVQVGKQFCKTTAQCEACPLKSFLPQYR